MRARSIRGRSVQSEPVSIRTTILPENVHIVSDGKPHNTHVYDKYGNEIKYLTKIAWEVTGDNPIPTARLELCMMSGEVDGKAKYFVLIDSKSKEVKRIEFMDGTELVVEE